MLHKLLVILAIFLASGFFTLAFKEDRMHGWRQTVSSDCKFALYTWCSAFATPRNRVTYQAEYDLSSQHVRVSGTLISEG
ncbi:MAG TPA: hypothetical protein VEA59_02400, partial [Patescibacteria group bacterium]|nr:hypothetical protein [Patescibacteria group bacterium]